MSALSTAPVRESSIGTSRISDASMEVAPFTILPLREEDVKARTIRHNRERADQTQIEHLNGSSDTVDIDLSPYLPSSVFVPQLRESFQALQKWEGYVLDVLEETFLARLTRIRGEGHDQEAEIYLQEVDQSDRHLITPGAVFYWSIRVYSQ